MVKPFVSGMGSYENKRTIIKTLLAEPQLQRDLPVKTGLNRGIVSKEVNKFDCVSIERGIRLGEYIKKYEDKNYHGHIVKIKEDLDSLKRLWNEFPELHHDIFNSKYYTQQWKEIVREVYSLLFIDLNYQNGVVDIRQPHITLSKTREQLKKVLRLSPTFIDHLFSGKMKALWEKTLENHSSFDLREDYAGTRIPPDPAFIDYRRPTGLGPPRKKMKMHNHLANNFLIELAKSCLFLDGERAKFIKLVFRLPVDEKSQI